MKANELRIGNLLQANIANEVIQVSWLTLKHIQDGNWQCPPYNMNAIYSPIPLTEEWLLKCGFDVYHEELVIKLGHRFFLSFHTDSKLIYTENTDTEESCKVYHAHIRHIHQLQNLYFALTGQEIEVSS